MNLNTKRLGICWQMHTISTGSSYYRVWGSSGRLLMEFEIHVDGRRTDYLALDAFWGRVPRPLL